MNKKIKVKFVRVENLVLMKCIEMPEKYRGTGTILEVEEDGKKFGIYSALCPEFESTKLYLWGSHETSDNEWLKFSYRTVDNAKNVITTFAKMIHFINKRDEDDEDETDDDIALTIAQ